MHPNIKKNPKFLISSFNPFSFTLSYINFGMGHHQKSASCSAIPSFQSFTSVSTSSTKTPSDGLFDFEYKNQQHHSNLKRSTPTTVHIESAVDQDNDPEQLFPLPSFCLYSKRALVNEYALESDILQFLSPRSAILKERLPMFVGVLHSLFQVVKDIPSTDEDEEEEEDEDEEEDEEEEADDEENMMHESDFHRGEQPFTIIGLGTMKLVVWNSMYDHAMDKDVYEKDLCLVVIVSSQVTDNLILQNMNQLKKNVISSSSSVTASILK